MAGPSQRPGWDGGARQVLVTGATGLVGTQLLEELREIDGLQVTGTSARGSASAVAWDLAAGPPPPELRRDWDVVIHAAADVRWTMTPEVALRGNVAMLDGLRQVVGPRTHVVHVSTAYATGLRGSTDSDDLFDYRNTYEWAKARAERLAAERFPTLTIVRPPMIVGRRSDGRAARYSGMYVMLRGLASSTIPALPADAQAYCDTVPVDALTAVLADLALLDGPPADGPVLTVAGGAGAPRVGEVVPVMVDALNAWRLERGLEPFGQPRLLPPEAWHRFFLPFAREHLSERQRRQLDLLRTWEPYLELYEPHPANRVVAGGLAAITPSVRFWADSFPRLAAMPVRPWRASASADAPEPASSTIDERTVA